ncbi:major facilitator superfamily domain-containing protein [Bombardia bombarda]|uniref:Major facilitator superfamily domain-containing protein n=1 Tax=Bombardia bombarda TaxID=252184 RepID=A0AA39XAM5_9PEZI|nr:major facilitator superfamily domain-containing protein [Bombardia bombarda]
MYWSSSDEACSWAAWKTVIGSTATITATFGVINSIGTFQSYLATHQLRNYNTQQIGWIASLNIFLCFFLGVQFGPWFDRWGPRWLMAGGSLAFVLGMLGMSFAGCDNPGGERDTCDDDQHKALGLLMSMWGVACGISAAVLTTSAMSVLPHWFKDRLGLANGIAFAGSSLGGVVFPLVLRKALEELGWGWSVRIVMFTVMALLFVANAFTRGRTEELNRDREQEKKLMNFNWRCLTNLGFFWATIGIGRFDESEAFALLAVYNGYVLSQSLLSRRCPYANPVFSVCYRGSFFGRIGAGWVSDRIGPLNTVNATLIMSLVFVFGLWIPVTHDSLALFYAFSALFGLGTGSIMSMTPVCISKFCKPHENGRYYGTSLSVVSFFTLFSIPVSAEILSKLGPTVFIILFGVWLAVALGAFVASRWYCLGRSMKLWIRV